MSIIIGIDPGSVYTGYGIIRSSVNTAPEYLTCGRIVCGKGAFEKRLQTIHTTLTELMAKYKPSSVAVESVFVQKNVMSALKLGHARGVAILACTQSSVNFHEYTAREVKKAITGYGAATKGQMQFMIRAMFNLDFTPSEDASDGLAIAITHSYVSEHQAKLKQYT